MDTPKQHRYPYSQLVAPLVAATMRASESIIRHVLDGGNLLSFSPAKINREFVWLVHVTPAGKNRHLIESSDGLLSLRTSKLRARSELPEAVALILERLASEISGTSSDLEPEWNTLADYIQPGPTRISSLLLESFRGISFKRLQKGGNSAGRVENLDSMQSELGLAKYASVRRITGVPSPLAIVYDFLTVPEMPGTRAFSLLACRNYLFTEFQLVPKIETDSNAAAVFTPSQIEDAASAVWTSLRARTYSLGQDKLPPGRPGDINGLLRHFLAAKRMLQLYFRSASDSLIYFERAQLLPSKKPMTVESNSGNYEFEFGRSRFLEKLPDVGEIVNELWGLPIPIRGADTIFRGGLKFSTQQGLVVAIHGGPGSGKTSLALALAAYISPFGIETLYLTAEEARNDLIERVAGLVPDAVKRLDFFPTHVEDTIHFEILKSDDPNADSMEHLERLLADLETLLASEESSDSRGVFAIPKPCNCVIVLDGLHDLFATGHVFGREPKDRANQLGKLYGLVKKLRRLRALVILTTGVSWAGDSALDYLVDVAIRLNFDSVEDYGAKPDRRITLSKARHQLCAAGTHGLQIAGANGVRFSPQINYQLDRRSYWKARLPNKEIIRPALRRATKFSEGDLGSAHFFNSRHSVDVFDGSHVFINGQGSGGKAALALRLALSPVADLNSSNENFLSRREKILVVSFLYPYEYYDHLHNEISKTLKREHPLLAKSKNGGSRISVIHLYPGHLRPHNLFNRIEWELEGSELRGDPYTCVVIDGIHNVFLQFPEIEKYSLFWPQLYSNLRSRNLTAITTHTTLALPFTMNEGGGPQVIDDRRSEPLRHALVQKSDFQFEIDPWMSSQFRANWDLSPVDLLKFSNLYLFKVVSSLGQRVPSGFLLWSREDFTFFEFPYLPATQSTLF